MSEPETTSKKDESADSGDTIVIPEKTPKTKTYFLGVTKSAPVHHITISAIPGGIGITFPCHTSEVVNSGSNYAALAAPRPGGRIRLYDDEVKLLRKNIAKHFIRWYNKEERRGEVVTIEGDKQAQASLGHPQDSMRSMGNSEDLEPLSKYLWLLSEEEITPVQAAGQDLPPTIWEMENGG